MSAAEFIERQSTHHFTLIYPRRMGWEGRPRQPGRLRFYRRFDFLAATPFGEGFVVFCFDLGFGVELARIEPAFEASISDSSYASRSQSVMGASTSSRCLI
jgi:hypothetical protein